MTQQKRRWLTNESQFRLHSTAEDCSWVRLSCIRRKMAERQNPPRDQRQRGCTEGLLRAGGGHLTFVARGESVHSQEWPRQLKLHLTYSLLCTQYLVVQVCSVGVDPSSSMNLLVRLSCSLQRRFCSSKCSSRWCELSSAKAWYKSIIAQLQQWAESVYIVLSPESLYNVKTPPSSDVTRIYNNVNAWFTHVKTTWLT